MARPTTILALLALLLGAASHAHGGFVDDLRESVELLEKEKVEKPPPAKGPATGADKRGASRPAGASNARGKAGAKKKDSRGGGRQKK